MPCGISGTGGALQPRCAPRVAARAFAAAEGGGAAVVAAPLFCMGFFGATRRQKIISYGVSFGVAVLIVLVRTLPQPWRGVVDAGVVVGLSWGVLAILFYCHRAARGDALPVDAEVG